MTQELAGISVLVVEDRAPVAMALCDRLADQGATIVGPAAKLAQAIELAASETFHVALLDVDLAGEPSYPLARALRDRGMPVILMTGYDVESLPDDLRTLPLFDKLGQPSRLALMIAGAARHD